MPFSGGWSDWPTMPAPTRERIPPELPATATQEDDFARRWQGVRLAVSHTENMSATDLNARIHVVFEALGLT